MSDANKLTFHAFTELVANRAKVSRVEADAYLHQLAKTMGKELEKGGDIHLYRFGRFHTTHVDEQMGHDPNSGAPLTISEHTRVHFRPYSALRFAVNAPFRQLRIKELTEDKTAWRTRTGSLILLILLLVLLILLGIGIWSWIFTQDTSVMPEEKASGNLEQVVTDSPTPTTETTEQAHTIPLPATETTTLAGAQTIPAPETETAPPAGAQTTPAPETETAPPTEAQAIPAPAIVATAPAETSTTKATATVVTVSSGDTLWAITESTWGDPFWWPVIYAENRPVLSRRNPDLIDTGITLRIPSLAGSVNNPTAADLRLKARAYQIVADDYHKLDNSRAEAYASTASRGFNK